VKLNILEQSGERKKPFHEGCAHEAHGMQREANVPSGAPMEKPNGRIMASAFVITNEVLHQAVKKPPTSASVYKLYDSDDEAMVGIDAELATPSSLSPKQHVSLFLILRISVFQISVVIIIFVYARK